MVKVQGGGAAAACVTVKVCPPIVIVPVRAAPPLAAILKVTVPLPVPDPPPVTAIQGAFDVAVHAQSAPVDVVTATLPVPASAAAFLLDGLMEKLHAAASCEIVKVFPAAVSVPLRAPPVLALTLNATDDGPLPAAPLVIEIHAAFDTAVHGHPPAAETVTVSLPPAAAIDVLFVPSS